MSLIEEFNKNNPRIYAFISGELKDSIYRRVRCYSYKCWRHLGNNYKLYVKHKYEDKNGTLRVFPKATSFCVACLLEDEFTIGVQFASSEMKALRELYEQLKQKWLDSCKL